MLADLPRCAVLGTGTMGAQIALALAMGGASVTLWGRRADALPEALERCGEGFDFLADRSLVASGDRNSVMERIVAEADLARAVSGAGFVVEAVAEDIRAKQELLARSEFECQAETILSSTTSALSATEIQSALRRPENFCVAHYAQPAHLVELVEVVPGRETSKATVETTVGILERTGKIPVRCPDIPGFLWARIQHAVLREFASLVGRGLVTPEACDTILKVGYASRLSAMGAFEHADLAGLDLISGEGARAVWADLSNVSDPLDTPVGKLFAQGKLGMKSGKGFYDWTERDAAEFKQQRDEEIIRRVKINRGAKVEL